MAQLFRPSSNSLSRFSVLALFVIAPNALLIGASELSRGPWNTRVGVPLTQPVPFSHEHHVTELGIDCRYCHTSVEKSSFSELPPTQTCMSCHSQIWTNSPLLEPVRESYRTGTPIVWNQVNKLPDFVYFNHSIHVDRGINCNFCHGAVEKMMLTYKGQPFQMLWCLTCHRDPARNLWKDATRPDLTPEQQVFNTYWKYQTDPENLSPRERTLMDGVNYEPSAEERAAGEVLLKERHIKKEQLTDCWVCHR